MNNKEKKAQAVKSLSDKFEKAKAVIFTGYRGLKVSEMGELRGKLREHDGWLKVVKNRILKRTLADRGWDEISEHISEPTAVAIAETDLAIVAKALVDFAKGHKAFDVRGGWVEGKAASQDEIKSIAALPSRDELFAKALSSMSAPATNFVGVLAAVPRSLVCAINAIKDTKSA